MSKLLALWGWVLMTLWRISSRVPATKPRWQIRLAQFLRRQLRRLDP